MNQTLNLGKNLYNYISWRPNTKLKGIPIPLRFNYQNDYLLDYMNFKNEQPVYYGWRPADSLSIHEKYAKGNYQYNFPTKETFMLLNLIRDMREKY